VQRKKIPNNSNMNPGEIARIDARLPPFNGAVRGALANFQ